MLIAQESVQGLKKGQAYTVNTDGEKAVFKTRGGRKVIFIPIDKLSKLKMKSDNDE